MYALGHRHVREHGLKPGAPDARARCPEPELCSTKRAHTREHVLAVVVDRSRVRPLTSTGRDRVDAVAHRHQVGDVEHDALGPRARLVQGRDAVRPARQTPWSITAARAESGRARRSQGRAVVAGRSGLQPEFRAREPRAAGRVPGGIACPGSRLHVPVGSGLMTEIVEGLGGASETESRRCARPGAFFGSTSRSRIQAAKSWATRWLFRRVPFGRCWPSGRHIRRRASSTPTESASSLPSAAFWSRVSPRTSRRIACARWRSMCWSAANTC